MLQKPPCFPASAAEAQVRAVSGASRVGSGRMKPFAQSRLGSHVRRRAPADLSPNDPLSCHGMLSAYSFRHCQVVSWRGACAVFARNSALLSEHIIASGKIPCQARRNGGTLQKKSVHDPRLAGEGDTLCCADVFACIALILGGKHHVCCRRARQSGSHLSQVPPQRRVSGAGCAGGAAAHPRDKARHERAVRRGRLPRGARAARQAPDVYESVRRLRAEAAAFLQGSAGASHCDVRRHRSADGLAAHSCERERGHAQRDAFRRRLRQLGKLPAHSHRRRQAGRGRGGVSSGGFPSVR